MCVGVLFRSALCYVMLCDPVTDLFIYHFFLPGDLLSIARRVKRSADTLVTRRDVEGYAGFKVLEATLMADELVAKKYGESNIDKHLLLIGNIVSMLLYVISCQLH